MHRIHNSTPMLRQLFEEAGPLHLRVVNLLHTTDLKYAEVAEKVGVHTATISHIATGRSKNPSVTTIERLYAILTGTPLQIGENPSVL